jgi:hypothetical protein
MKNLENKHNNINNLLFKGGFVQKGKEAENSPEPEPGEYVHIQFSHIYIVLIMNVGVQMPTKTTRINFIMSVFYYAQFCFTNFAHLNFETAV